MSLQHFHHLQLLHADDHDADAYHDDNYDTGSVIDDAYDYDHDHDHDHDHDYDDDDRDDHDHKDDVTWRRSFLSLSLADSFKVFTATVLVP